MKNSIYRCPFCEKKKNKIIYLQTRAGYQVNQCTFCKLVFRVPMPTKEKIHTFYEKDYVKFLLTGLSKNNVPFKADIEMTILEKEMFLRRINFDNLIKELPDRTIFEVGCGIGDFLKICEKKDFSVSGCDLSAECIQYVKKHYGYKIIQEYFEDIRFEHSYSLIALWSVIEHVRDPKEVMKKAHGILKPNGLIIVACPNIDAFMRLKIGPYWKGFTRGHTLFFSKKTLTSLLESVGFADIKVYYKRPSFQECFNRKTLPIDWLTSRVLNYQSVAMTMFFLAKLLRQMARYFAYRIMFIQPGKLYVIARKNPARKDYAK